MFTELAKKQSKMVILFVGKIASPNTTLKLIFRNIVFSFFLNFFQITHTHYIYLRYMCIHTFTYKYTYYFKIYWHEIFHNSVDFPLVSAESIVMYTILISYTFLHILLFL